MRLENQPFPDESRIFPLVSFWAVRRHFEAQPDHILNRRRTAIRIEALDMGVDLQRRPQNRHRVRATRIRERERYGRRANPPHLSGYINCVSRSDGMRSSHATASRLKREYVIGTWDSRPRLLHVVAARLKMCLTTRANAPGYMLSSLRDYQIVQLQNARARGELADSCACAF